MNYKPYTGSKFYCTGITTKYDMWCNPQEVKNFAMTRGYKAYLRDKQVYEDYMRLCTLKDKIEYQVKTYGEADELDVNLYKALIAKFKAQRVANTKQEEHQTVVRNITRFSVPSKEHAEVKKSFMSMYTN